MKQPLSRSRIVTGLTKASTGKVKADLVVKGVSLVNVYTAEVIADTSVAISGDRFSYVGPDASHTIGPRTRVMDGSGYYAAPGLIDGHTHIDFMCSPSSYAREFLRHGTTAVFGDPVELVGVLGLRGLKLFLSELRALPIRGYALAPMCSRQDPYLSSTHALSVEEMAQALSWNGVVGIGELSCWTRLLDLNRDYLAKIALALEARKRAEGHTSGAKDWKLAAQVAAGISSCHEAVTSPEVRERLRMGIWTMLRQGFSRQDLRETIRAIIEGGLDSRRAVLVTDSIDPAALVRNGHMDHIIATAIEEGIRPPVAIQMATLNAAEHYRLDDQLGAIAPGLLADMVLLSDLKRVTVKATICGGRLLFANGKVLVPIPSFAYPRFTFRSVTVAGPITPAHFSIPSPGPVARARVMELVSENITKESVEELAAPGGFLTATYVGEGDLIKVAVIDRHYKTGRMSVGLLRGFGASVGAFASTLNFDENNLVVMGARDEDMALAANRLVSQGGGMVVMDRGRVLGELPMPVAGVFSERPATFVARRLEQIKAALKGMGCPWENPLKVMMFITFVTLPSLRITDRGLVDVKRREFVPLIVAEA